MKELQKINIYDITSRETISVNAKEAKFLWGMCSGVFSAIKRGSQDASNNRFCLNERRSELIKTILDISTGQEYECFYAEGMRMHLKLDKSVNISAFNKIFNGKCSLLSFGETVYCLKGKEGSINQMKLINLKNKNPFQKQIGEYKLQAKIRSKLSCRIRRLVRKALSRKFSDTINLVGCSMPEFINYISLRFEPGMTWENYGKENGKWHIDHIIPCNTFDLTTEENQRRCFHYTNLRPLWAMDNWRRPKDGSDIFYDIGINI